jgi:hypothetical protein
MPSDKITLVVLDLSGVLAGNQCPLVFCEQRAHKFCEHGVDVHWWPTAFYGVWLAPWWRPPDAQAPCVLLGAIPALCALPTK